MRISTSFLFDLDGTLVDSVYQHVLAWKEALDEEGIELSVWRIHRKIGMSGGLFTNQLLRETGGDMSTERVESLRRAHARAYRQLHAQVRPLPGAQALLAALTESGTPWAIATSGRMETAAVNLEALGVDPSKTVVVTRDDVKYAKPDPDLFVAAAQRLKVQIEHPSLRPWWSATASGTCWPPAAAARWAWACCRAATARKNLNVRARCASTKTLPICSNISTRSPRVPEYVPESSRPFAFVRHCKACRVARHVHRFCHEHPHGQERQHDPRPDFPRQLDGPPRRPRAARRTGTARHVERSARLARSRRSRRRRLSGIAVAR